MAVKPIPDGYRTATPFLVVQGVSKPIDFLKQAFEAQELHRTARPDGTIMHAKGQDRRLGGDDGRADGGVQADAWLTLPVRERYGAQKDKLVAPLFINNLKADTRQSIPLVA